MKGGPTCKKMYLFKYIFYIILGVFFSFISLGFLTQSLEYNSYHLSEENNFSSRFVFFTHLCSFEWKSSYIYFLWNHMNGTFHMELKWYNQLIFNIWLGISSKLTIIWIFLKYIYTSCNTLSWVYFHKYVF
jgi:hypothetical protein